MAKRVRQCSAHCKWRHQQLIDSLNAALLDVACDGQAIAQDAFGGPEQRKGVAMKLTIVDKLRAVGTPEPRDAEQALRHVERNSFLGAEERNRRSPHYSIPVQSQAAKKIAEFAGSGVFDPASAPAIQ